VRFNAARNRFGSRCRRATRGGELLQPVVIGSDVRARIRDLTLLLDADSDLLARAGAAVLAHETLPHPVLHLVEELYPQEVARARFTALWSERDAVVADPRAIGCHFKAALASAMKLDNGPPEPDAPVIRDRVR